MYHLQRCVYHRRGAGLQADCGASKGRRLWGASLELWKLHLPQPPCTQPLWTVRNAALHLSPAPVLPPSSLSTPDLAPWQGNHPQCLNSTLDLSLWPDPRMFCRHAWKPCPVPEEEAVSPCLIELRETLMHFDPCLQETVPAAMQKGMRSGRPDSGSRTLGRRRRICGLPMEHSLQNETALFTRLSPFPNPVETLLKVWHPL